ncbi:probable carboxylesterase 2 [Dioscorea cayenensis subsp. rotundata]|uniref:Probable carboxylesterase 2 n=1 Tax=Dioscorea cayennensis subsp. rotundata TaxID=55577 RepID=A0AB40D071_DIOCR|nr:probable carboxylesterase 2 [Dioscorea cayenensis subsp. rotundata]
MPLCPSHPADPLREAAQPSSSTRPHTGRAASHPCDPVREAAQRRSYSGFPRSVFFLFFSPAAYDDCWKALKWVVHQLDSGTAVPEPWLVNFGDSSRQFLAGDSAGANIAHHMAMRAGAKGSEERNGDDAPYFWGSKMEGEEVGDALKKRLDELWMLVCPASAGVDDPMINPLAKTAPDLGRMPFLKIMVCVAEKDLLSVRAMAYYEKLKEKWVDGVELVMSHGMDHVFHLDEPGCDQPTVLTNKVVAFLSS